MKSLIWKEWRETRWIAIGFLLICILTSLYGKTYLSGGETAWHIVIQVTLTVLVGARAFAGEKESRTMEFLAAQPLRKTHLWAFKAAWGLGIVLLVFAVSALFDYVLMLADPFYNAAYLLELPLTWTLLALIAIYAVALFSTSVCDKTLVAAGLAVILWFGVASVVALIDRFNRDFFQFLNEPWGVPLALLSFILVVLAGSFLIVTWREVWPNRPRTAKGAAVGAGIGSLIVLAILSSANIPPDRITRLTSLGVVERGPLSTQFVFSVSVDGKRLPRWRIDLDGENLVKASDVPFREREHPAWRCKHIEGQRDDIVVMRIERGENAGGYVIEKLERVRRVYPLFAIPRRVRTVVPPLEGASLSWLGVEESQRVDEAFYDIHYFVEELPDGERYLRAMRHEGDGVGRTRRIGKLLTISPNRKAFIFRQPDQQPVEGKLRLNVLALDERLPDFYSVTALPERERDFYGVYAGTDILESLSLVTDSFVQYKREGNSYLCDLDYLSHPYLEASVFGVLPVRTPTYVKIPERILSRGPEAVRQLAQRVEEWNRKFPANMKYGSEYASVEDFRADLVEHNVPREAIRRAIGYARSQEMLESVAAGWGADMPEELLGDAIFPVRFKQAVYLKRENEQQSSLWLLELESCETTKILDDIDVASPAEPKALVAPIMENYFAFVRDAKTIWTYRDGVLKQIFPPQP